MKTKLIFKLEGEPEGFNAKLSPDCKVKITNKKGPLILNYENRRIVGSYDNLRLEGEVILADIELNDDLKLMEDRFQYSISGKVLDHNDKNEGNLISVDAAVAIMNNKF